MDFIKNKPWITGVVVALLLVSGWWWLGRTKGTVTVTGTGSVVVPVGQVSMVVTAAAQGTTAGDAVNAGEILALKLVDLTKNTMGKDTIVRKGFYQISPQSGGAYIMAEAFSVKSASVTKTNDLIRVLFASGANTVSSVSFIPKDELGTEAQVRQEAIKDARLKAEVVAKATGKRLGGVVSVADDNSDLAGTVNDTPALNSNFSTVRVEKKLSVVFEIQ